MKTDAIAVRHHGSAGGALLVLHGGPGAPGSALGLAVALSERYRVSEPLQRLSGPVPLTVAQHVSDLAEVAPERAAIVGHSWGAMLALSYAASFPERAAALVLVCPGTYDRSSREHYQRAFRERMGVERVQRAQALREALADTASARDRDTLRTQLAVLAADVMSCDADAAPQYARVDARANQETWQDALRLQALGVEPERFAAIRVPVLLIHGEADPHPGPRTAAVLRTYLPQLDYLELARCGHEPWGERHARAPFLHELFAWLDASY